MLVACFVVGGIWLFIGVVVIVGNTIQRGPEKGHFQSPTPVSSHLQVWGQMLTSFNNLVLVLGQRGIYDLEDTGRICVVLAYARILTIRLHSPLFLDARQYCFRRNLLVEITLSACRQVRS